MTAILLNQIAEKRQELKLAEQFFNHCSEEAFDRANARLSLIREELSALYREAKSEI